MLLDTYTWIEHFKGSEKGEIVDNIVLKEECYTSILSLAEVAEWCLKNKLDMNYYVNIIKKLSKILELTEEIILPGAIINFECKKSIKNWGIIDSLIYATARFYNLKILTGDKHFENLEHVVRI